MKLSPAIVPAALAALAVAGCGGGSKSTSTASHASNAGGSGSSSTASAPASTASGVAVTTKSSKLGTILAAGPKRMTVYLFEADHGAAPTCLGACASVWPPVTTAAAAVASGQVQAANLGEVTRSDGTKQVTYAGHPLYFYARDGDQGDAYGAGIKSFGAGWYVLAPSGKKIDNS